MNRSHVSVTQAGLVALATTVIGQIVAFVPSAAAFQQILISAVSAVIAAAFLVANAIHHLAHGIGTSPAQVNITTDAASKFPPPDTTPKTFETGSGKVPLPSKFDLSGSAERLRTQLRNAGMEPVA